MAFSACFRRRLSARYILVFLVSSVALLCFVHIFPALKKRNEDYVSIPKFSLVQDNTYEEEYSFSKAISSLEPQSDRVADVNPEQRSHQKNSLLLPTVLDALPYLAGYLDSLFPAIEFPNSTARSESDIVIGVPSVARKGATYLFRTLESLLFGINKEQSEKVLIVVMIATESGSSSEVQEQISSLAKYFSEYFNSGLLHVIVPPKFWYPDDLHNVEPTLGDSPERMYWRTKQNLDYLFLMLYCQPLGKYYLQLEDDVITKKDFMTTIMGKIQTQKNNNWFLIEFSSLGFIGKLFRSRDLRYLTQFIALLYRYKPVDWILDSIFYERYCLPFSPPKNCSRAFRKYRLRGPTLFQHVGLKSSLDGKVQKLKEKSFKETMSFNPHTDNPAANASSSMPHYRDYTIQKLYDGLSAFWSAQPPKEGDYLRIEFLQPAAVKGILVRSGNAEHPADVFNEKTVLRYQQVKSETDELPVFFDEIGLARINFETAVGLQSITIEVNSTHDHWVVLSEFLVSV